MRYDDYEKALAEANAEIAQLKQQIEQQCRMIEKLKREKERSVDAYSRVRYPDTTGQ